MAIFGISLFFQGNRTYGIGNLTFDLELAEQHNFDNIVTEHAVEDGSVVNDHIQNLPENGSVTGLVTNFSINSAFLLSNRAQDFFNAMVSLWKNRTLVKMVTVLNVYEDVAIVNVAIARDEDTGESAAFEISFKKVNVVTLQQVALDLSVQVTNLNNNQNRKVAPTFNAGATVPVG